MNKGGPCQGYMGMWLPGVLARMFVLENLEMIEDFTKAYAQHVGALTTKALCSELKDLLEGGDVDD